VIARDLIDIRNALVKCPFIFNFSWSQVGVLSIPRDKNVKGLGPVTVGSVTRKVSFADV